MSKEIGSTPHLLKECSLSPGRLGMLPISREIGRECSLSLGSNRVLPISRAIPTYLFRDREHSQSPWR
jgi:hypothetical protein